LITHVKSDWREAIELGFLRQEALGVEMNAVTDVGACLIGDDCGEDFQMTA
jgi:hypothetical protein